MLQTTFDIVTFLIAIAAFGLAMSENPETEKEVKNMKDQVDKLEQEVEEIRENSEELKRNFMRILPTLKVLCNINNVPTKDELREAERDVIGEY